MRKASDLRGRCAVRQRHKTWTARGWNSRLPGRRVAGLTAALGCEGSPIGRRNRLATGGLAKALFTCSSVSPCSNSFSRQRRKRGLLERLTGRVLLASSVSNVSLLGPSRVFRNKAKERDKAGVACTLRVYVSEPPRGRRLRSILLQLGRPVEMDGEAATVQVASNGGPLTSSPCQQPITIACL